MSDKPPNPGWLLGPFHFGPFCFVVSIDDFYVGLFLDRDEGVLYIAPFPTCIIGIRFRKPKSKGLFNKMVY